MAWVVQDFGVNSEGTQIKRFTAKRDNGIEVSIVNIGGAVTCIKTPDRHGKLADIVAGFDNILAYEVNEVCFGATVGRCANRTARGRFTLDGLEHQLAVNDGKHHLHGGNIGFHKKVWDAEVGASSLKLTYVSPDGEENYPGELSTCASYELQDDNSLRIEYNATASRPTIVNLTNHSCFNLAGHQENSIEDHTIQIYAEKFTPKDEEGITTGEMANVSGTLFDLRNPVVIGDRLRKVPGGCGYDHNFCITGDSERKFAARVVHETSGRTLEVYTNQPGLQFYTGYFINACPGKDGVKYEQYSSLALEAQNFPDAANKPNFPCCIVRSGQPYHHTTWYKFGTTS